MEERSIRIELAGRAYPLTISASEEENVRQAVAQINESMDRLKEAYPLTDKQDLLAMAALEVTTRAFNNTATSNEAEHVETLERISEMLNGLRG